MFDRNLLLYGDNLDFLRDPEEFPSGSVDLIYLDPPFNSNASYNVLFKEAGGEPSAAQIKAFDDTWSWDASAANALFLLMDDKHTPGELKALIQTFHPFLGHSPMLAYLVQMAVRLVHMRRVLKNTGSLYLHCDPTASHYLKLVLDAIFGTRNFLNEIVWYYRGAGIPKRARARRHDILLHYAKREGKHHFNPDPIRRPYADATVERFSHYIGNVRGARDYGEQRLHPLGKHPDDVITHIQPIAPSAKARLGYPTQKPEQMLREIVAASSKPGDLVLDPFCGCGTTIDAVETLNREDADQRPRRWIGIDITHLAVNLIKYRLSRFDPPPKYDVHGEPRDLAGARQLFKDDPYEFQFWACGLVGARPAGSTTASPKKGKKGADRGVDGKRYFADNTPKVILVQVKGGRPSVAQVRDFRGTLERENAAMGVFITLQEPTAPMRREAATAGVYRSPMDSKISVPKLQIVTVAKLLEGGTPRRPSGVQLPPYAEIDRTFKNAKQHNEGSLFIQHNE